MTEKIKDRAFGWVIAFLFILLGWIAAGVGWLVVDRKYKDDYQDKQITKIENHQAKIARILYKDEDTCPDDKDELRPIYFNTRSGQ